MKTKVLEKYNAVIIELKGDVMGGDDTKEFNQLLHKLIEEGKKNVVIDLGEVKFMNSSGLGMLISGLTTIKRENGSLKLANVTERIESLLIITKLITIFESYDSVDEAIKSFS
ncbi:MAG TPA: STAS domain-containing protein [Ignavibacteriaceae bacterium]|jgi:anti-sigma B factor antagonist|nr:MAG: Anti-sigma-B factor antagonist [Ignavibacteria bacterium ADurb.Bin266]OQY71498.1 MAG: anti-anti-sigma factor [Ignavibacteriales bacterium UTCHB2]HQF42688.1 STAS domain-containing protein [Ignavibacteriaceae bacterium]HQI40207.1 STAS domain-containing protein [Ignavibacteriaceae bacterium]HQJ46359.1 STAS domain-containing protein [Ignavibacteriaceae bacterium]